MPHSRRALSSMTRPWALQSIERARHGAQHVGGDMVYRAVVSSLACPSRTWITRTSVLHSNRCVAKECRLCLDRYRRHYLPRPTMSSSS